MLSETAWNSLYTMGQYLSCFFHGEYCSTYRNMVTADFTCTSNMIPFFIHRFKTYGNYRPRIAAEESRRTAYGWKKTIFSLRQMVSGSWRLLDYH